MVRLKIILKAGTEVVATIEGRPEYDALGLPIGEVFECERIIERVTGYRAHVEIMEGEGELTRARE
jgi:hypothetical protein